ncbi:DUF1178 family protein [Aquabacterium sp.]|jgi:hypothetical protein|uniref:DUF1178 family protein n=1 Tax=Aquabacterium sp. TaxID=1872578 RepID=UPI00248737E4|nr:DUF1178 family protein [Aquabacterium sp.]MDI1349181.1 DUF1178 family protein [Aquabacterium sp.]
MLVVDLHCDQGHAFEGWFASGDELLRQQQAGLVGCPVCGSHAVLRRPSATRLNVSGLKGPVGSTAPEAPQRHQRPQRHPSQADQARQGVDRPTPSAGSDMSADATGPLAEAAQALQAAYLQVVRQVIQQTENVGEHFADEARRIHHGDAPERAIRGQATAEERAELREEGIDTLALPVPKGLDGPLQ